MSSGNKLIRNEDFTILFVDDEVVVSKACIMRLRDSGYNVLEASSGAEALEIVRNEKVDIVLLDYFMPEMTGEEVVKRIRTFNHDIIIILQTAYSGQKPPLQMLEELDIQGYHDKSDGIEKLIVLVLGAVKVCYQKRMNKNLFEQVELANKTIESVRKYQDFLIEQTRLATLGEMAGNIADNLSVPLSSAVLLKENIQKELTKLHDVAKMFNFKNVEFDDICFKINQNSVMIGEILNDSIELAKTIWKQSIKSSEFPDGEKFTLGSLISMFSALSRRNSSAHIYYINEEFNLQNNAESIIIEGKIISLLQALMKLVVSISKVCEKHLDKKTGGTTKSMDFKIIQNNKHIVKFEIKYSGADIINNVLNDQVITKDKADIGFGAYTVKYIITECFGGEVWTEKEDNKILIALSVPIKIK